MQNGVVGGASSSVSVVIDPVRISELEGRIDEPSTLLSRLAGQETCCIFRVPQSLAEINQKAYQPHIASIGPYYHHESNSKFKMIQEHKWRFLGILLARTRTHTNSVSLSDLFEIVSSMETEIRASYSEVLVFDSHQLIEMIVLDGCFIIELFCKIGRLFPPDANDPLFNVPWILPSLMRDLLRLENQIPYFVLKALFELCVSRYYDTTTTTTAAANQRNNRNQDTSGKDQDPHPSLAKLVLVFFNYMVQRPVQVLGRYYDRDGMHLLDLFWKTYIPPGRIEQLVEPSKFLVLIQSAKKLHLAGVKFKPRKADSLLDVRFKDGVLEIPVLSIDDFSSSMFLNFVAYEQCYFKCTKHITTYATFMGCLINTPADAGFLGDRKIIENYFGTDDQIAQFFNDVRKDIAFDIHRSYLAQVFADVNEYYRNDWHVRWAGFKHTYFNTPWSFMSALAAVVLLMFTLIQAFFAAYAYFRPPKSRN